MAFITSLYPQYKYVTHQYKIMLDIVLFDGWELLSMTLSDLPTYLMVSQISDHNATSCPKWYAEAELRPVE